MEKEDLTEQIIGCAMTVHKTLGPGYLESVYKNALLIELQRHGINAVPNHRIPVHYQGEPVGDFVADIVIENAVILELKAAQDIHASHEVQLVNYLKSTGIEIGLILNFGASSLQFKRKHRTFRPSPVNLGNPVHPVSKKHAFTLVELLVAMGVLSILLVVLLNVVQSSTLLWRTTENRAEAYREARAALQIMASDLEALFASTNTNYFQTNLPGSDASTLAKSQIGFLATLPLTAQSPNSQSDVCSIGFFAAYGPKSPIAGTNGQQGWNIYRYFIESNETFANLTNGRALFSNVTPSNTNCEILARNVLDLQITPLVAETNTSGGVTNFSTNWNPALCPLPHLVEIRIVSVNNERSRRLLTQADWTALRADTNSSDYLKNTKIFTTRVNLSNP